MACGKLFFIMVVTCSAALITYNIILSANAPLRKDFPGPSHQSSKFPSLFSADSIIKLPSRKSKRLFHTAVTASDSIYNTWQCRVMYYWFKKQKNKPNSDMGGFTRILHSGQPDRFMDEIPTFVAQPLPSGMDQGYVVLNRPWAFVQWLQQVNIEEDYVLMSEPDHILVKPIPNLSREGLGAAFPFFYIEPKKYETVLRKFFPEERGPITNIDPIGNSPVIVGKDALKKIAPTWMNVSLAMKKDRETDKTFGWVLEMYAYAVASALHGVGNILHKEFMIQVRVISRLCSGNIYLERCGMSELRKAGECFSLAGNKIATEVYAKGSFFHECLSPCTKGNYFDLGFNQSCIRFGFAEDRSLPRSFLVNRRVVALGFQKGGLFWIVDVMEWEESL